MEFDKKMLGQTIREHRIVLGYTQEKLAEKIDISVTHMKHIESGHRLPSIEVLFQLVILLQISLDTIWLNQIPHNNKTKHDLELLLNNCTENELFILADVAKTLQKYRN